MKQIRFNETQIRAIANLLLEIGKWLLLTVVFGSFFVQGELLNYIKITVALIYAFLCIAIAIWILREVKKDG